MPRVCSCQSRDKDPVERRESRSATDGSDTLVALGWCFYGFFFAQSKMTEGEIDGRKEVPSNLWLHGPHGGWDSWTYLL